MSRFELFYPTKPFHINQAFGVNKEYYKKYGLEGHNGLDLRANHSQNVRAAHDGEVVYAGVDNSEGWGVVIRTHGSVEYNGGTAYMKSIYWHFIKTIPVKVGSKVRAGDIIGYADNTGASTGDHLHFAIKPQAKGENDWTWLNIEQNNGFAGAIDPMPYFNKFYAADAVKVLGIYSAIINLLKKLIGK